MKARTQYRVVYRIDPVAGWWVATVRNLPGCLTEGRTIEQTRRRIREAIAEWLDLGEREYGGRIVDEIRLPARTRQAIEAAQEARQQAADAHARAAACARAAARDLIRLGLSLRDAGELLGVTRQRAHQLLDPAS